MQNTLNSISTLDDKIEQDICSFIKNNPESTEAIRLALVRDYAQQKKFDLAIAIVSTGNSPFLPYLKFRLEEIQKREVLPSVREVLGSYLSDVTAKQAPNDKALKSIDFVPFRRPNMTF